MDPTDPAAALLVSWLTLVLGEADRLRAAGVISIGGAGCSVTFAAPAAGPAAAPVGEIAAPDAAVPEGLDALNDPHSYPGGVVPGYRITKFDRFEPPEE